MPEVSRKENLGLETVGERLTTAWNYLVGCQALRLQDRAERDGGRRVWECTLPRAGEWRCVTKIPQQVTCGSLFVG